MMNGDSVLLKMIIAFIYIWKKIIFLAETKNEKNESDIFVTTL